MSRCLAVSRACMCPDQLAAEAALAQAKEDAAASLETFQELHESRLATLLRDSKAEVARVEQEQALQVRCTESKPLPVLFEGSRTVAYFSYASSAM
eukprot:COSAG05_NODE_1682_length_4285_cov_33.861682_10_plen_96_part_00